MKKNMLFSRLSRFYSLSALLSVVIMFCSACSSDNSHSQKPDETPQPQNFEGTIVSSIPDIPSFVPSSSADKATITWNDENQTTATIEIGGFHVDVAEVNMSIEIGDMKISPVGVTKKSDGSFEFVASKFECQAGAHPTSGTLSGTLANGVLNIEIIYKPGSMPMDVKSIFTGSEVK